MAGAGGEAKSTADRGAESVTFDGDAPGTPPGLAGNARLVREQTRREPHPQPTPAGWPFRILNVVILGNEI